MASLLFMLVVTRTVFIVYNRRSAGGRIALGRLWEITRHGILSDFVVAAYLTSPLWLASWILFNISGVVAESVSGLILGILIGIEALCVSLITLGDTALYDFWHFKIDSSVLSFLKNPRAAFASVSTAYLALAAVAIVVVAVLYFFVVWGAYRLASPVLTPPEGAWGYVWGNLGFLLTGGLLAVIARGLRIRPNNPTIVYYSKNPFDNHAALNSIFSFTYSLGRSDEYTGQFRYFDDDDEVESTVAALYPTGSKPQERLLSTDRPNILFIVWESLSARFVGFAGGNPEVTPCLNALAGEGIAFANARCCSFLTDRGLVCLLSGLPGQPTTSVVKYTKKLPHLPAVPKLLRERGYETKVIHGGDLSVRQKADYYLASGHDTLIAEKDFPSAAKRCKWGVHDEVLFDRVYDEIMDAERRGARWFTTVQTLSSHEPFDVPYNRLADKMENAFAYTDACLGRLIERLKASPEWENMLVVISADHGANYGSEYGSPLSHSDFSHVAMLMAGGAIAKRVFVDRLVSQTDLAATLLAQMGLPHDDFIFSRDIFAPEYIEEFTFQSFHHGIVINDADGVSVMDTDTAEVIEGDDNAERIKRGKMVLQRLYKYLSDL